jgi:hypothetical protein
MGRARPPLMGSRFRGPGERTALRGRTSECALLDDLTAAVRRGEGRSLVLRGEAGIGKTALLDYLIASASDLAVVRAVGVESEMELAYASLHQLCVPLLDRLSQIPVPQRQALEIVFGLSSGAAPGGDWGAIITDVMAVQAPPELIGMHTNMAGVVPADASVALARNVLGAGGPPPSGLSADEQRTYDQLNFFYTKGIGYGIEMITQPQTLYGIADSPVGLAAWMINHDAASYADIAAAFAGHPVGNLTRDEVLDNVTFYWLTNTAISSARLYWENTYDFFGVKGVAIPAAVSVFPNEIYRAPRSWAERAYPNLIYFNEVGQGCHFAAWQEPALFTGELRAAFRSLR